MIAIVHPLGPRTRTEIVDHLHSLSAEDRRLRFGVPAPDIMLQRYADSLDFDRDAVFGVRDDRGTLTGMTHVAPLPDGAELGLSVRPSERGQGLAQAMFSRAILHARNRGWAELYMHCLAENAAMMHIARKNGMRIVIDGPERDAFLALPPATPLSVGEEFYQGQLVLFDRTLRNVMRQARLSTLAA
ncbi:MAG: GNAT family N-acetyltransferase [Burkholderiaceae bacterium]